jgi:hypothetical protein
MCLAGKVVGLIPTSALSTSSSFVVAMALTGEGKLRALAEGAVLACEAIFA